LDLAGELKEERVWWAADYGLSLFRVQMKRKEELTRAAASIAAALTTELEDAHMWGDKIVESVSGRTSPNLKSGQGRHRIKKTQKKGDTEEVGGKTSGGGKAGTRSGEKNKP
jgi:hypothetical protein